MSNSVKSQNYLSILVPLAALLLAGCSQKPREVHLHSDECAHCKMMITDPRFAAQIVTETGKSVKFDAIECMADYYAANEEELKGAKRWVSNFSNPVEWIEIGQAVLIKSKEIQSPMGESLLALKSKKQAREHLDQYSGETISWKEIK